MNVLVGSTPRELLEGARERLLSAPVTTTSLARGEASLDPLHERDDSFHSQTLLKKRVRVLQHAVLDSQRNPTQTKNAASI
jgi:hypothetical protein